jgi:hypothetical protein
MRAFGSSASMVAAEAAKLKRAAGDLVEAENEQIALWSELVSMQMPHLAPQLGSSPNLSCLNAKSPAEC